MVNQIRHSVDVGPRLRLSELVPLLTATTLANGSLRHLKNSGTLKLEHKGSIVLGTSIRLPDDECMSTSDSQTNNQRDKKNR